MSLEAAIAKLTAAVEANTAALEGGASAPADKGTAKKPAAGAKKAPAKKPATKKGPTADDIAEQFGSYMKEGDADERAQAKANVRAIIEAMETDRLTNLDPEQFGQALEYLEAFKAGEDPFEEEGGEEEGDDDLM